MRQFVDDGASAESVVCSFVSRSVEGLHSIMPIHGLANWLV